MVSSIKDDSRRNDAIGSLANGLLSDHRDAAVTLIAQVPPEASVHLTDFLENWCREDPKAAFPECARRMDALSPGDPIRKDFADFFKNNFAGSNANDGDPLPIANFLVADANPDRTPWIEEVTRAWAQRDFAGAMQWMDAQNDPAVRERAIAGVAEGGPGMPPRMPRSGSRRFPRVRCTTRPSAVLRAAHFSPTPIRRSRGFGR